MQLLMLMALAHAAESRPNFIVILADDLDMAGFEAMAGLREQFTDEGLTFTKSYVSLSLCCPSRTTLFCGEYAHNHGVYGNRAPDGGYDGFKKRGLEDQTLGVLLQAEGYRTAYFGKFLNGYEERAHVPPGWTTWAVPITHGAGEGSDYKLNENGRVVAYGDDETDYITDVLADKTVAFVKDAAERDQPFLAVVATLAPHIPAIPARRHRRDFKGVEAPRLPSFDEANLSDKPAWLSDHPPLDGKTIRELDELWRKRLQSMLAVEELVSRLVKTLESKGLLDSTYLVFTSDNGFHLGLHRLGYGKDTAFEEDVRVPLVVRGPGVSAGRSVDALVGNVDLAPTLLELALAPIPARMDGRSLVPLLRGPTPAAWRQAYLLEHSGEIVGDDGLYQDDDGPVKQARGNKIKRRGSAFVGVHTGDTVYLRYDTGEVEYYDLARDPYELENLASTTPAATLDPLDRWARALATCRGEECRRIEEAPPRNAPSR